MKLAVQGFACLGSFGFGPAALRECVITPVKPHEDDRLASTDTSELKNIFPAKSLRHMGHFTRMALYAAAKALEDAEVSGDHRRICDDRTALVLATGYGPAAPTFDFLDSIIANGDHMASPLAFSHSVHNIPTASIAILLGLAGPCATICQLDCPVTAAFLLAYSWLMEGKVDRVLLGAVDEHTPLLAATGKRIAAERSLKAKRRGALPLGEGAIFFYLERYTKQPARHATLEILALERTSESVIKSYCTNKMFCSGRVPQWTFSLPQAVFAEELYGNVPVAQAFDIIFALHATAQSCVSLSFGEQGLIGAIKVTHIESKG
jgi:3-oxoacyl-[acyl-carrier-protein] synthase II